MSQKFIRAARGWLLAVAVVGSSLALPVSTRAAGLEVTGSELISADPLGFPGNDTARAGASITPDGRFVLFLSHATNLVPGVAVADTPQYYVYDRVSHAMDVASQLTDGSLMPSPNGYSGQAPSISADGRYVVFAMNGQIFLRDRTDRTTIQLDSLPELQPRASSVAPNAISRDGSVIVFDGYTSDLYRPAAVVYHRATGVSTILAGHANGTMSADGQNVYMAGEAFLDPHIYKYQVATDTTSVVPVNSELGVRTIVVSPDQSQIMFMGNKRAEPSHSYAVFLYKVATGETTTITLFGRPGSFSDDNRIISYALSAPNSAIEQHARVRDTVTGEELDFPIYNPGGFSTQLSGDGHLFAYSREMAKETTYDAQIYVDQLAFGTSDTAAPTLGTPVFSPAIAPVGTSSVLTVPAADDTAVTAAEYFIGDTDPGVGLGLAAVLGNVQGGGKSVDITVNFASNPSTGVFPVSVRARDAAGNWSLVAHSSLVVYDPASPVKMTGKNKKDLTPSLSRGDILPGLIAIEQADTADYGLTVKYKNDSIAPSSDFSFYYATGTHCKKPTAQNCHELNVSATSISWLVISGSSGQEGRFQGVATVTADGVVTTNPFTVTGVDGDALTPSTDDSIVVTIYAPGANPATADPLYRASGSMAKGNSVKLK